MSEYTREELIAICEAGVVPHDRWRNRDTPGAQQKLGQAWAYLRAGCNFRVLHEADGLCTNNETVWIEIDFHGFGHFDWGEAIETEHFYLPTWERLEAEAGKDWY